MKNIVRLRDYIIDTVLNNFKKNQENSHYKYFPGVINKRTKYFLDVRRRFHDINSNRIKNIFDVCNGNIQKVITLNEMSMTANTEITV